MTSIGIFLYNCYNNNTFYPGQTLTGRVECNFNKDTNVNGKYILLTFKDVRVQFQGKAETEWIEFEKYYDHDQKEHRSREVKYHAEELYFNVEYTLFQGEQNVKVSSGRHVYTFSYALPTQLPSSFEGFHGNVRYYIKATLNCFWKLNYEDKLVLNIISPLDLNCLPGLKEPASTSIDKTVCFCCCSRSGELTFNMSLPVTGFIPGEEIKIGTHIENMTNINVSSVKFQIVKDLEFVTRYPKTKRKFEEIVIAKRAERGIGAHGEKFWTSTLMLPTNVQYPNLLSCSIINIAYCIKATVVLPLPHTNLNGQIPIMIGSIPLSGVATTTTGAARPSISLFFCSDLNPTETTPLL